MKTEIDKSLQLLSELKMRDPTPEELQGINNYLAVISKPIGLSIDDIIENRPIDKVVKLAKEIYNIGYEDGVQATNVDCGVVWEERIEDIKAEIQKSMLDEDSSDLQLSVIGCILVGFENNS